jgi:cobalt-zinc-cadmium efflux system membrane fusion protein
MEMQSRTRNLQSLKEIVMKGNRWRTVLVLSLIPAWLIALAGCGESARAKRAKARAAQQVAEKDDHSGWWCAEHGVPEEVCGLCSSKVGKELKAKGDWCGQHDRPDSQCFICHPEYKEKFAAQYRAKYGKEPPPTEDEEKSKSGANK